jgi:D-alanyl-lipoteichoic acid acyltransferase DltB (MBOAT superfamily)
VTLTFNSLQFFAFLAIVLVLYYRFDRTGQNTLMFIAGSVFYASFNWKFVPLLYLSIGVDYVVGRRLGVTEEPRKRRALLGVSLVTQLGILAVFKYYNFFSSDVDRVLGHLGLDTHSPVLNVVLPVGISFYTFQTLAYVITVYRRQMEPERDLVTFAAFVAWFPQLVAGPIERPYHLIPQVQRRRQPPPYLLVESSVWLILRGLFKKVVLADGVAGYVNAVYASPRTYGWQPLVFATVGFAIQVYGDFSGYSDIARGVSRLLGVELRRNFEQPFLSRNMQEFWRRWHTSLGWWFTEFVGRPLGGAGAGRGRAVFNTLVIFTLIGLWHGAAMTFVFWGVYNGVLVAVNRFTPPPRGRHPMKLMLRDVPAIVLTFALFCGGAIFFRALSLHDGLAIIHRILSFQSGTSPAPGGAGIVPLMLALMVMVDLADRRVRIRSIEATRTPARLGVPATRAEAALESVAWRLGAVRAGVVVGLAVVAIVTFSGSSPVPFIYFRF